MARQDLVEKILEVSRSKIDNEVGGLLGVQLNTSNPTHRFISKQDYFQSLEKLVFTKMKVEGDIDGEAYMIVSLKDAILLGGTLIMLPAAELENHIQKETFGDDEADAFGEVANLIAGAYSASFEEHFPEKVRLVKTDLLPISPSDITIDSADPCPDKMYYMSSCDMKMDDNALGQIHLLFPPDLLGIEVTEEKAEESKKQAKPAGRKEESPGDDVKPASPAAQAKEEECETVARILVIAEESDERQVFVEAIEGCGYNVELINYSDNIKDVEGIGGVQAVFLIMCEVSEQGVAAIIKAKSACGKSPLIAAGPQWTRKAVLQAVKYGACDIVVTPAGPEEIKEKVVVHLENEPQTLQANG